MRVSQLLGGVARAYVSEYPEIATDLDRPSDFEAMNRLIGRKKKRVAKETDAEPADELAVTEK